MKTLLPRRSRRSGFSMVELLVVMSVVSLLAALLLPAVQQAREAARRAQCKNNLKQLALAVANFTEMQGHLPAAALAQNYATWAVQILPQLDQSNIYNNWNLNLNYYLQPANAGANLPIFQCPSDQDPTPLSTGDTLNIGGVGYKGPPGSASYQCNVGSVAENPVQPPPGRNFNGPFKFTWNSLTNTWNSAGTALTDVLPKPQYICGMANIDVDGASNTLFVGERHLGSSGGSIFNSNNPASYYRKAGGWSNPGSTYYPGLNPATGEFDHYLITNGGFPLEADPGYEGANFLSLFGSYHPGLCQFALGDGSVRAISVNIDFITYSRLAIIEDYETVGDY